MPRLGSWLKPMVASVSTAALLVGCAQVPSETGGAIEIDGSSTVYPITQAIADAYNASENQEAEVNVAFSGTTGGFRQFCAGETDISDASRPISSEEIAACREAGVRYIELPVAFDALVVTVNEANDWVEELTIDELTAMWEPRAEGNVTNWRQIRPEFPDRPLTLFGPGADSGTFDYFTEAVIGESGESREDYVDSEDDTTLVRGVSQDPNALGYFGLAYFIQNPSDLKTVAIVNPDGDAIEPSRETVEAAEYQPLARPLFIYVNAAKAQDNPALRDFVDFYLDQAAAMVTEIGYVPLPEEAYHINRVKFETGQVGTVFGGESQFDLTIAELLRRQEEF